MNRNWKRLSAMPLLAAALWVAACSEQIAPTEPLLTPAQAELNRSERSASRLAGSIPEFDVSATIGPEGGSLGVEGYTLTVPRNAVSEPTVFTFASIDNGYIQVQSTATTVGSSDLNDVGRAGFKTPVLISLSYSSAGGVPSWLKLVLAYVGPDGTLEPVPSRFNVARKVVTGAVSHFSDYALVMP